MDHTTSEDDCKLQMASESTPDGELLCSFCRHCCDVEGFVSAAKDTFLVADQTQILPLLKVLDADPK